MWVAVCWTDEDMDQLQGIQGPFKSEEEVDAWADRESISHVEAVEVLEA